MDKREWELIKQENLRRTESSKPKETKKKEDFSIILFADSTKKPLQISIPRLFVKAAAALCLAFVIFAGYSFANSLILKDADVKKTALEQEYQGKVKIVKVDVTSCEQTAVNFNIRNIPALLMFKNGEVVATQVGAAPKSKLTAFIDDNI